LLHRSVSLYVTAALPVRAVVEMWDLVHLQAVADTCCQVAIRMQGILHASDDARNAKQGALFAPR
jgi:hypothetical protein